MWGRWRKYVWPVVIGLVALLPFVCTLNDPFVSDDWNFLWLADARGFSVTEMIRTNTEGGVSGGSYRPVVNLFWRGLYQVAGLHPLPYRVATIGFHVANTVLLFFLLKKILKQRHLPVAIAGLSAILFAITPSKAEIAWVSVVNDTLAVLFILLASWTFVTALGKTQWKKYFWHSLSVGLALLALATKEFAVLIPIIIFVLSRSEAGSTKTALGHTLPYLGVIGVFFVARYLVIGVLASDYTGKLSLTEYQAWRAYISYAVGFFVSGYPRAYLSSRWLQHLILFNGVAIIGLAAIGWVLARTRLLKFGLITGGLFVLSAIPVVRFAIENSLRHVSEEGERFLYFPSVFLSITLAVLIWSVYQCATSNLAKKSVITIGLILGVGMYSTLFIKTWRWHQAARVAGSLVEQGVALISTKQYDGYVVIGLPDQYHGAQIFRNAYPLALSLRLSGSDVPLRHLIAARVRVLYEPGTEFSLTKISDREFRYTSSKSLLLSVAEFVSTDYTVKTNQLEKEKFGISIPATATSTVVQFTPQFIQGIQADNQKIAILYFSKGGWSVTEL